MKHYILRIEALNKIEYFASAESAVFAMDAYLTFLSGTGGNIFIYDYINVKLIKAAIL